MSANNLPNPQVGSTPTSKSTSDGEYIAPVIAVMNADASGTYGVLQRAKVTITNIDQTFNYLLSETESVGLTNLFRVLDADLGGDANKLDNSANVLVELKLDNQDDFHATISAALAGAWADISAITVDSGSVVSPHTVTKYMEFQSYNDTLNALKFDTLANMLGADDLRSYNMNLDISGGAASLIEKLDAASAAVRKTLYTQMPESNTEKYLAPSGGSLGDGIYAGEDISGINFLPFVVGDKIVFVFDVTVGQASVAPNGTLETPSSGPAIDRVLGDASLVAANIEAAASGAGILDVAANTGAYASGNGESLTFSAPTRRRIALTLMLSRESSGTGSKHVLSKDALGLSGEGFVLSFQPETSAETYQIDPAHPDYELMLAAGMFHNLKAELTTVVGETMVARDVSNNMPASDISYDTTFTMNDISDGENWQDVIGADSLIGASGADHYGRFAFIPGNNKTNFFRIEHVSGNEWKLQVNVMQSGVSDGILYYIENTGGKDQRNVEVRATKA
jgi:hypothetical protein